ncbi:acyl-CoA reductase [Roseivirga sp. E12]|uniref:acyl-CoA reductase n=1 Tax=Roseivirga sp. E12 TaxID=2819237 RepID=UPI001ABBF9AB|nr:acyl-CoA reductase [Roseivirga sp. E12]MBO3697652.1 acyl-CoA reductase [Roseivirga sp. E12]
MTIQERKEGLSALGNWFGTINTSELDQLVMMAGNENSWFTPESVKNAFAAWAEVLNAEKIEQWTSGQTLNPISAKRIGLIMAGNIPLVGLHDLLTVLISGNAAHIKYSSQDRALMSAVVNQLTTINPGFQEHIKVIDRLNDVDAIIATGSDNSARYFKHYFSKYPHIIRQNRVSIGILDGNETEEELAKIGQDAFQYFGLGCRNVSKVFVPKGFELPKLIKSLEAFGPILDHHKYRNNYDYNKSIYLVNGEPHLDSGFFLMRESEDLVSPISVIYYEVYDSPAALDLKLSANREKIQCMVSRDAWYEGSLDFGSAQTPELWDYADGVDTLEFLEGL